MFTTTWNPLEELTALHRDMDRVFGRRFGDATSHQGRPGQAWTPPIEVASGQDAWRVRAALPGIDAKALRIDLQGNSLTIAGERVADTEPEGTSLHSEFPYGPFERTLQLPTNIDGTQVAATYHEGILELTLPIAESAKARRIEVGGDVKEMRKLA